MLKEDDFVLFEKAEFLKIFKFYKFGFIKCLNNLIFGMQLLFQPYNLLLQLANPILLIVATLLDSIFKPMEAICDFGKVVIFVDHLVFFIIFCFWKLTSVYCFFLFCWRIYFFYHLLRTEDAYGFFLLKLIICFYYVFLNWSLD